MKSKVTVKLVVVAGIVITAILAMSLPMLGGCPAPEAAPPAEGPTEEVTEEYHWRFQAIWAPAEIENIARPWLNGITEMSGGRLTFELYSAGELVPEPEVLPAVQAGTLDMVHECCDAIDLPLPIRHFDCFCPQIRQNPMEWYVMYYERGLKDIYEEAYESLGDIEYIGTATHDPMLIYSTRPIRHLEDFEGLKLCAFEAWTEVLEPFGVEGVMVPVEEFYLAGKTGEVDAMGWAGAMEGTANSWYEVYPYLLGNIMDANVPGQTFCNKDSFDALPKDIQAMIRAAERDLQMRNMIYYYEGEPRCRKNWKEVTYLPDDEWQKVVDSAWQVMEKYSQESERCAKIFKVAKEYAAEVEAANWDWSHPRH